MIKDPQHIVDTFISTIYESYDITVHFRNAMRDAMSYRWPTKILNEILSKILNIYKK
jgi:hypothetical protein